jgi:hypothetical protein
MAAPSFLDMWVYLLETRLCLVGFVNLAIVLTFHVILSIRSAVIGPLQESEIHAAQTLFARAIPDALQVLVHPVVWDDPDQSLRLLFPFICRFLSFVFRIRVDSFPLVLPPPLPSSHPPLFFCQIVLLLVFVNMFARAATTMSVHDPIAIVVAFQAILGFIDTIHGLIKHVIFFIDVESHGNSLATFTLNAVFDFLADTMQLFILGLHAVIQHVVLNNWLFSFLLTGEYWTLVGTRIADFWKWRKLCSALHEKLPAPTPSEITDSCVICRLAMTPDDSRKLPCGHCCHSNCLVRWASEQATCPLCGLDLGTIIEEPSRAATWMRAWIATLTKPTIVPEKEIDSDNPFTVLVERDELEEEDE